MHWNGQPLLDKNETVSTNAVITTDLEENATQNEITITANVEDPKLEESVKIIIDNVDIYKGNRTIVEDKIRFAADLFEQNPECLDLKELLTQAEEALKNKEFKKALALVESAIEACRKIVGGKGMMPPVTKPRKEVGFKINLSWLIIALLILIALIILVILVSFRSGNINWRMPKINLGFMPKNRKHGQKRIGPKRKEIKSFESEEKEIKKMLQRRI